MNPKPDNQTKQTIKDLKAQLERLGYGPYTVDPAKRSVSVEELKRTFRKKHTDAEKRPKPPGAGSSPAPVVYTRSLPRDAGSAADTHTPDHANVELNDAVDGQEVTHQGGGKLFLVSKCVREIAGAETLDERFEEHISNPSSPLARALAALRPDCMSTPEDVLFMDIETTGLASSPLFLIGVMVWTEQGFEVRQFLARNYAEERPVVASFCDVADPHPLLVTFNGKSFDLPYIRARAAATGVRFAVAPAHLDLLHVGRRFWKTSLPNCKLQTLERFICGRIRHGDIPGSEIPEAYHHYVRTENAYQIVDILEHNMLDLVTLADIMTRFPNEC